QLCQRFDTVAAALERMSRDPLASFKRLAMVTAEQLLSSKPHGEARLLALLVNKLGDPDHKTSAQAVVLLQQLLSKHPAMRGVAAREVQQYLHRPGLAPRAVYAGVVFLTQVYLKPGTDEELAASLVKSYFSLFERAIAAGDLKSKLLSALLTGVNRAHPYLPKQSGGGGSSGVGGLLGMHVDKLFKMVHQSNFSTSTQALMLLFQLALGGGNGSGKSGGGGGGKSSGGASGGAGEAAADDAESEHVSRFYSALYSKLLSAELAGAHNPTLFLNLFYKGLKLDRNADRVAACAKRLLQVASGGGGSGGGCGGAPMAAGALFVVSEVLKKHQQLRGTLFMSPDPDTASAAGAIAMEAESGRNDDDDGPEHANGNGGGGGSKGKTTATAATAAGRLPGYDPAKRDPRHACTAAEGAPPLWEASLLRFHVHPSVQRFAEALLMPPGHGIRYSGDPLADFALAPFLDKMAYRGAKVKKARVAGQQHGHMARATAVATATATAPAAAAVNDEAFLRMPEDAVSADKVFFHRFFLEKARRDRMKGIERKPKSSAAGSAEGGDADAGSVDEEAEMDAFATGLAEDLMRSAGNGDIDEDMEKWSSDDDDGSGGGGGGDSGDSDSDGDGGGGGGGGESGDSDDDDDDSDGDDVGGADAEGESDSSGDGDVLIGGIEGAGGTSTDEEGGSDEENTD
ncbi:unnamed protein product, partial [Phaeothamnion confervicola]